ncbi:MFS transporter [Microlunatus soli]|uniref:Predicted arabinose efflux permease, MFS family n=1 Tax=Microlunatus soli TaxID=630515 RepID=A0A1H1SAE6_9ACTN|nr:MFS transporter [Microlunatus soli]SDS44736.1 Predicted arabinose efflux permease, MFS family [Microlunatus soli]
MSDQSAVRRFCAATAVSLTGDAFTVIALPFAILAGGGTAGDIGFVLAARATTAVVFLLFGGVIGDRFPRKNILIMAALGRGLVMAVMAVLCLPGMYSTAGFVALQALHGIASSVTLPATTGLVRDLAGPSGVLRANSRITMIRNVTTTGAPVAAGAMLAVLIPFWGLAIDAVSYGVAALLYATLPVPARRNGGTGILTDLKDGWRAFISFPWLWRGVAMAAIFQLGVLGPVAVLGPVVAQDELGGASIWGFMTAANGLGAVIGSWVVSKVQLRDPLRWFYLSLLPSAAAPIALGLTWPLWAQLIAQAAAGWTLAFGGVLWETVIQTAVPPDRLSRVSAYDWLGSSALRPLSLATVGPLVAVMGPAGLLIGVSTALVTLAVFCSMSRRATSYQVAEITART